MIPLICRPGKPLGVGAVRCNYAKEQGESCKFRFWTGEPDARLPRHTLIIGNSHMRNIIIGVLVAAVVAGFLGYTAPGHRLLNSMGLAAACGSSDNC